MFAKAHNWNAYLGHCYEPYIRGRILEVGAGIGTITKTVSKYFAPNEVSEWVCIEPDSKQNAHLLSMVDTGVIPPTCSVKLSFQRDLQDDKKFDLILYSDVLEHIEDDQIELSIAAGRLNIGGHLLVMSPAHNWLFSDLDRVAGHYRRYTKKMIQDLKPKGMELVQLKYLDSLGVFASLANKLLLKRGTPTPAQITVWDKVMIRFSRLLDHLILFKFGKSILVVWRKIAE